MRVAFRVDASAEVGTGHAMRCLALADALREHGATTHFIARTMPDSVANLIQNGGHRLHRLLPEARCVAADVRDGSPWLKVPAAIDSEATKRVLAGLSCDCLVVDHYGLDRRWEEPLRDAVGHILVIDDLADRPHHCEVLLDQNYPNALHERYRALVPADCSLLLGPRYALIRPQFAELRESSLARSRTSLSRLLVFMSGTDRENETSKALAGIALSRSRDAAVDVVIGGDNQHRAAVEAACARLSDVTLHVQTSQMAQLMAQADLMLCAGGSTNWERCTLGLPGLLIILADNQVHVANSLAALGASELLGWYSDTDAADYAAALDTITGLRLASMSQAAAAVCDGAGLERVVARLDAWAAARREPDGGKQ